MNDRAKNIVSAVLAALIVGFACFAILYWIMKDDVRTAAGIAVAATFGGLFAPVLVNYFKKKK